MAGIEEISFEDKLKNNSLLNSSKGNGNKGNNGNSGGSFDLGKWAQIGAGALAAGASMYNNLTEEDDVYDTNSNARGWKITSNLLGLGNTPYYLAHPEARPEVQNAIAANENALDLSEKSLGQIYKINAMDDNSISALYNFDTLDHLNFDNYDISQSTGEKIGGIFQSMAQGASSGSIGGPWGALGGAVTGLGAGLVGAFRDKSDSEAAMNRKRAEQTSRAREINFKKGMQADLALNNNNNNIYRLNNMLQPNISAFGGPLFAYGGNWTDGINFVGNGYTHEKNALGGVPMGIAPDGQPNLVEEGEVIWNDYVFSNRLKVPKKFSDKYKIKEGSSFAEAVKELQNREGSKERPNDPITKRSLDAVLNNLATEQEIIKQRKAQREQEKMMRAYANHPEFIQGLASMQQPMEEEQIPPEMQEQMMQEQMPQEQMPEMNYSAYGGYLHGDGGPLNGDGKKKKKLNGQSNNVGKRKLEQEENDKYMVINWPLGPNTYQSRPDSVLYPAAYDDNVPFYKLTPKERQARTRKDYRENKPKSTTDWMLAPITYPFITVKDMARQLAGDAYTSFFGNNVTTYANGGPIHIAPSKKGTFTAAATKHGMGVQEFANKVLANPEDYSPAMRKKANFARNASHWHDLGGHLFAIGGPYDWENFYKQIYEDSKKAGNAANTYQIAKYSGNIADLEKSQEYLNFTNYILNDATDEERLAYFDWIDKHTGNTSNKYLTKDKKLVSNWKDMYKGARTDKKYGVQHLVPGVLKEATVNTPVGKKKRYWAQGDGNPIPISEETYNAGLPGYKRWVDKEGNNAFEYDDNYEDYYLDYVPTPETPNNKKKPDPELPDYEPAFGSWLRFMPAFGSGNAYLQSLFTKPEYTYADMASNAARNAGVALADYKPIGDYLEYNPFDTDYLLNKLSQQYGANTRNLINNSNGNIGALNMSLLAAGANNNEAVGDAYTKALEYNRADREKGTDFNRGTNQYNSTAYNKLSLHNTNTLNSYYDRLYNADLRSILMRQAEDERVNALRNQNYNNFFTNLGDLGTDIANRNDAMWLASRGVYGTGAETQPSLYKNWWPFGNKNKSNTQTN